MGKSTTKIVNLFGGPGTGKSTTAAGLFHLLKLGGHSCELITEWAKERVWLGDTNILEDQLYVFAKQRQRQLRLLGEVEYVITDSPILLAAVYGTHERQGMRDFFVEEYNEFNNVNVFLTRVKPFVPAGRLQTEDKAKALDVLIRDLLIAESLWYYDIDADENAPITISNLLLRGV